MGLQRVAMTLAIFGVALAGSGPALAQAGDAAKGKAVFARCAVCHATVPGKNGLGPTLSGIVGSKAAAVPGYNFSPAMKGSKIVWTSKALDTYLTAPMKTVPGTKMAFAGLSNPADRANLIAFLSTLK